MTELLNSARSYCMFVDVGLRLASASVMSFFILLTLQMVGVCVLGWKWPELQQLRWHPLRAKRAISTWARVRYGKSRPLFSKFFFHPTSSTSWKFVQVWLFWLVLPCHSFPLLSIALTYSCSRFGNCCCVCYDDFSPNLSFYYLPQKIP